MIELLQSQTELEAWCNLFPSRKKGLLASSIIYLPLPDEVKDHFIGVMPFDIFNVITLLEFIQLNPKFLLPHEKLTCYRPDQAKYFPVKKMRKDSACFVAIKKFLLANGFTEEDWVMLKSKVKRTNQSGTLRNWFFRNKNYEGFLIMNNIEPTSKKIHKKALPVLTADSIDELMKEDLCKIIPITPKSERYANLQYAFKKYNLIDQLNSRLMVEDVLKIDHTTYGHIKKGSVCVFKTLAEIHQELQSRKLTAEHSQFMSLKFNVV